MVTLSAVLLVAVMLLLSAGVVAYKLRQTRAFDWKHLAGGGVYILPLGYEGPDLQRCFDKAVELLATPFPTFPKETLAGVSVIVMAAEKWKNRAGETVGGEMEKLGTGYILRVEKGLSSLCHELAHVMEYAVDGEADHAHARWGERGVWKADEAYRAWLKEDAR
jgi:hypothetical protein